MAGASAQVVPEGYALMPKSEYYMMLWRCCWRYRLRLLLRRSTNQALPATHTIEVMFSLPVDFPFRGVNRGPGILMKQPYLTRGGQTRSGSAVRGKAHPVLHGLSKHTSNTDPNF